MNKAEIKLEKIKILDWYDGPLSYYIEDDNAQSYYAHYVGGNNNFIMVPFDFAIEFSPRAIMLEADSYFILRNCGENINTGFTALELDITNIQLSDFVPSSDYMINLSDYIEDNDYF